MDKAEFDNRVKLILDNVNDLITSSINQSVLYNTDNQEVMNITIGMMIFALEKYIEGYNDEIKPKEIEKLRVIK